MSRSARRSLLHTALSALIALDLLALVALVANQWFEVHATQAWVIAGVLAVPVFMLVRPLSDAVLAMADRFGGIPDMGEKIPGVGQ